MYSIAQLSFLTTLLGSVGIVTSAIASEPTQPTAQPSVVAQRPVAPSEGQQSTTYTVLNGSVLTPYPETLADEAKLTVPPTGAIAPPSAALMSQATEAITPPVAQDVPTPDPTNGVSTPSTATIQVLSPKETVTAVKSTDLVVKYPTGTSVQVFVNDQPLAATVPTQKQEDAPTNETTQVWYRIPLRSGENTLLVKAEGAAPVTVKVTVQETAAQINFLPMKEPQVPADGRSALTVEGEILNEAGQRIDKEAVVTLTASAGKFVGADHDKDRPGFQVLARNGVFTAQLQAGLDPQTVRIRAAVDRDALVTEAEKKQPTNLPRSQFNPPPYLLTKNPADKALEAYTQAEFITNLRPFILAGNINLRFGQAGLDFYNSYQDFLRPSLLDQDYRVDFGAAAFTQGRIGEWLFTGAFNNQRALNEDCSGATRLFRDPQFCDQVYPTYGDSSTVDYLTPSIDSVYFKIERTSPVVGAGSDFAMWGDYTTLEFARASQFYTATTRQLHGFKANYNLGDLQITMAYANNIRGFQRDTIALNGTSGYYFLARRLVIAGSENVFLESEELLRPGTVIERKPLYRGVDYEIDYDRGAILLRRNIKALEFDPFGRSLVRRLVTTYQYDSLEDGGKLYAGRVQYNFVRDIGRETWAGFTYLREDQGDQRLEYYGGDVLVSLGKDAQFIAEVARSDFDSVFQGNIDGYAYRFEFFGTVTPGVIGKAYYRSVEPGFTNNATASFTPGQTRYGAEVAARITPTTQGLVQFDREVNFGIAPAVRGITAITNVGFGDLFNPTQEPIPGTKVDNSLTTFRAGLSQKIGPVEIGLDWVRRSRQDRILPQRLDEDSNQLVSRLTYPILDNLVFRVQDERNLGDSDPLYPNRTTVGIDWGITPDVTVRLAQQFIGSTTQFDANSFTSLDILSDKRLSDDTTYTSRFSILNGVNGWSSQSAMGLNHRVLVAPGLRLNLGYERVATDLFAYTAAGQQFAQPLAVGQSASALGLVSYDSYSVGLDYTDNPNFKASGRFEFRDGDDGSDSMVISASAAGKLSPALTVLGRYQQANFANQLLVDSGLADIINIKMGMAYRNPYDDKFNALLKYEYRQNPSTTPDTILVGSGTGSDVHLFSLEAIYAPNFRWEFYGKFALRSTRSYLADDFLDSNVLTLGQFRTSYRFAYRWDATAEVRWISQSVVGFDEVGLAAELGYYLTPNLRAAVGYNFGTANDRDFNRTKDGVYVTLSLKLDELLTGFGVRLPDTKVAPKQQQESVTKPVATQTPNSQDSSSKAAPASAAPAEADRATPSTESRAGVTTP